MLEPLFNTYCKLYQTFFKTTVSLKLQNTPGRFLIMNDFSRFNIKKQFCFFKITELAKISLFELTFNYANFNPYFLRTTN